MGTSDACELMAPCSITTKNWSDMSLPMANYTTGVEAPLEKSGTRVGLWIVEGETLGL